MKKFLTSLTVSLLLLTGCSQEGVQPPAETSAFIEELKADGVDGSLLVRAPFNADMEYVAEYTVARYASTRIISLFKFKDAEKAQVNLQKSLTNDKLSGQAVNGRFVLAVTFHPPDEAAVEKIKALFLAHEFE
ncbi:MAG TPA: hypothetical protein ENI74_02385 [Gammaproteobacteria bacterium]|nr:hypothetical protein [Gammaproteobacteria bacterium]